MRINKDNCGISGSHPQLPPQEQLQKKLSDEEYAKLMTSINLAMDRSITCPMYRSEFNKRMNFAINKIHRLAHRRIFGSKKIDKIVHEELIPLMTSDHK